MTKILIIASLEKNFATSGVGKYILPYSTLFQQNYEVSYLFQPQNHGMIQWFLRRIFILPKILKRDYKHHIKILYDESFLVSWRNRMKLSTICIIHHNPLLIKSVTIAEWIMKPINYILFTFVVRQIVYLVAVSKFTNDVLINNYWIKPENLSCIKNSIDTNKYTICTKKTKKQQEEYLQWKYWLPQWTMLLNVAGAEWRKNIPTLITVLHKLPDHYFLVRIWKHRTWKENTIINNLVKKYKLEKRYIHLSNIDETDLVQFYQCAHLFLFPSFFEWFWRPPLEAQACGCLVIATKWWALWEVLWNSIYTINNPTHIQEWQNAIEELHSEQKRAMVIKKWIDNIQQFDIDLLSEKRKVLLEKVERKLLDQ
jgi:glycosyltransferase involved in cell wall biosynthesis